MSSSGNIPQEPSLERDKKEAKALKKLIQSGDSRAIARVVQSHPAFSDAEELQGSSFSLRDAQLVIAREYGFENWTVWKEYVESVRDNGEDSMFARAAWCIRHKRPEELATLLEQQPQLASTADADGEMLLDHTVSYANDPGEFMDLWTSTDCARLLVQAGAPVSAGVFFRTLETADTKMLRMLAEENVLPDNLRIRAAIGDIKRVRECFDKTGRLLEFAKPGKSEIESDEKYSHRWPNASDVKLIVADAFRFSIRHKHAEVAGFLLDRCEDVDSQGMKRLSKWKTKNQFLAYAMEHHSRIDVNENIGVWDLALRLRASIAFEKNDVDEFSSILAESPHLLAPANERFQIEYLEYCAYGARPEIAHAILDAGASIKESKTPSKAMIYAIDYGDKEMISILEDIWRPSDDLPTQAGLGDLKRVKSFFDSSGNLIEHEALVYPREGKTTSAYEILLHALGLALINEHLDVAEYLLERGADINGRWGMHEPAGLLHEMAANGKLKEVRFLVENGVDVTIRDSRFGGMAYGWAEYMGQSETLEYLKPPTVKASLWAAVAVGSLIDVKAHIESGAEINERVDFIQVQDYIPLYTAVNRTRTEIVELLLEHGADATHLDSNRSGALHRIETDSDQAIRIARLLVEHGCDINSKNNQGVSAVEHARENDLKKLETALLKFG